MPELPEVETTRRGIEPYVTQQRISDVKVREHRLRWPIPDKLAAIVTGQTISKISRRAKYLLLHCDNGTLIIHLGMSGRLCVLDTDVTPGKHDHVDIVFANGYLLRYTDPRRFGAILWSEAPIDDHALLNHLGPEPLSDAFNVDYLQQKATGRKTVIKSFIMNGDIVVGVGNIYANEALFLAAIHPARSTASLTAQEISDLVQAIKQVLNKAITAGGTTLRDFRNSDGKPGYFAQELNVYGRKDAACPQCSSAIQLLKQAQRATYFCPQCQH